MNELASSVAQDRLQQELFEKLSNRIKRLGPLDKMLALLAEDIFDPVKLANYPVEVKLKLYQILSGEERDTFEISRKLDLERLFPVLDSMEIFRQLMSMSPEQRAALKGHMRMAMARPAIASPSENVCSSPV